MATRATARKVIQALRSPCRFDYKNLGCKLLFRNDFWKLVDQTGIEPVTS